MSFFQLNKHQCPDTLHLTCKTKSCEAFKTKECPHYKIATHCSAEEQERCPEKCTKPLAVDCSCPDPIENCPEGSEPGWKPCRLSQEECANDTKCCDKICPEEGSKDGKRRERTCKKEVSLGFLNEEGFCLCFLFLFFFPGLLTKGKENLI